MSKTIFIFLLCMSISYGATNRVSGIKNCFCDYRETGVSLQYKLFTAKEPHGSDYQAFKHRMKELILKFNQYVGALKAENPVEYAHMPLITSRSWGILNPRSIPGNTQNFWQFKQLRADLGGKGFYFTYFRQDDYARKYQIQFSENRNPLRYGPDLLVKRYSLSHFYGNQLEFDLCLNFVIFMNKMIRKHFLGEITEQKVSHVFSDAIKYEESEKCKPIKTNIDDFEDISVTRESMVALLAYAKDPKKIRRTKGRKAPTHFDPLALDGKPLSGNLGPKKKGRRNGKKAGKNNNNKHQNPFDKKSFDPSKPKPRNPIRKARSEAPNKRSHDHPTNKHQRIPGRPLATPSQTPHKKTSSKNDKALSRQPSLIKIDPKNYNLLPAHLRPAEPYRKKTHPYKNFEEKYKLYHENKPSDVLKIKKEQEQKKKDPNPSKPAKPSDKPRNKSLAPEVPDRKRLSSLPPANKPEKKDSKLPLEISGFNPNDLPSIHFSPYNLKPNPSLKPVKEPLVNPRGIDLSVSLPKNSVLRPRDMDSFLGSTKQPVLTPSQIDFLRPLKGDFSIKRQPALFEPENDSDGGPQGNYQPQGGKIVPKNGSKPFTGAEANDPFKNFAKFRPSTGPMNTYPSEIQPKDQNKSLLKPKKGGLSGDEDEFDKPISKSKVGGIPIIDQSGLRKSNTFSIKDTTPDISRIQKKEMKNPPILPKYFDEDLSLIKPNINSDKSILPKHFYLDLSFTKPGISSKSSSIINSEKEEPNSLILHPKDISLPSFDQKNKQRETVNSTFKPESEFIPEDKELNDPSFKSKNNNLLEGDEEDITTPIKQGLIGDPEDSDGEVDDPTVQSQTPKDIDVKNYPNDEEEEEEEPNQFDNEEDDDLEDEEDNYRKDVTRKSYETEDLEDDEEEEDEDFGNDGEDQELENLLKKNKTVEELEDDLDDLDGDVVDREPEILPEPIIESISDENVLIKSEGTAITVTSEEEPQPIKSIEESKIPPEKEAQESPSKDLRSSKVNLSKSKAIAREVVDQVRDTIDKDVEFEQMTLDHFFYVPSDEEVAPIFTSDMEFFDDSLIEFPDIQLDFSQGVVAVVPPTHDDEGNELDKATSDALFMEHNYRFHRKYYFAEHLAFKVAEVNQKLKETQEKKNPGKEIQGKFFLEIYPDLSVKITSNNKDVTKDIIERLLKIKSYRKIKIRYTHTVIEDEIKIQIKIDSNQILNQVSIVVNCDRIDEVAPEDLKDRLNEEVRQHFIKHDLPENIQKKYFINDVETDEREFQLI